MNPRDFTVAFWRKSTLSNSQFGECVEAGPLDGDAEATRPRAVAVRDSKNPEGPKLLLSRAQWHNLLGGLKS